MTDKQAVVHVAVGVIVDAEQRLLIALRPAESHQGGLWEFPGGKLEQGETVQQALARELHEELGIQASSYRRLLEVQHDYGDKAVLLDVWWVDGFSGQLEGREGQPIKWVRADQLVDYRFPEANQPIVAQIQHVMNGAGASVAD
jgi:8-oxo-dGTP diphosphatase